MLATGQLVGGIPASAEELEPFKLRQDTIPPATSEVAMESRLRLIVSSAYCAILERPLTTLMSV